MQQSEEYIMFLWDVMKYNVAQHVAYSTMCLNLALEYNHLGNDLAILNHIRFHTQKQQTSQLGTVRNGSLGNLPPTTSHSGNGETTQ